jgi:anhydro-N-acetylmuramic acid kinase
MRVVALLSGTSVDAIDVAAADLTWSDDADAGAPEVVLHPLGHREVPWPDGLRERLLAVLAPAASGAMEICDLHAAAGRALGEVARSAVAELAGGHADLVVSHGQTVAHQVAGDRCLGTLQLGGPSWIAEATGLPVVSDLRSRDIAAGGHGAPLASTFDALWLSGDGAGEPGGCTAALNLGGIANVTVVHRAGVRVPTVSAWDTGPANCLLDLAAARVSGGRLTCDLDGELAAAGRVHHALLDELLREPYYALRQPKSTGRELFDGAHLDRALDAAGADAGPDPISGPDLLATLVELSACTVARALGPHGVGSVVVSGGGTRNPVLMRVLRQRLGVPVRTSDELGVASEAKEAYVFALVGFLAYHQLPCVPARRGARGAQRHRRPVATAAGQHHPRRPSPRAGPARSRAVRMRLVAERLVRRRLGVGASCSGRARPRRLRRGRRGPAGRRRAAAAAGGRLAVPGLVDLQVNGFDGVDVMGADAAGLQAVGAPLLPLRRDRPTSPPHHRAPRRHRSGARRGRGAGLVPPSSGRAAARRAPGRAVPVTRPHGHAPRGAPARSRPGSAALVVRPRTGRRGDAGAGAARGARPGAVAGGARDPGLAGAQRRQRGAGGCCLRGGRAHGDAPVERHEPPPPAAPGLPGAALSRPDVVVQMILDGHHLAPEVVRMSWAAARSRVVLVTDATAASARPDGQYEMAGVSLEVQDGAVRNPAGRLAGSALTLDAAVRCAVDLGIPLLDALQAATATPAGLLGRTDVGTLVAGQARDLVVLDDGLQVHEVHLAQRAPAGAR